MLATLSPDLDELLYDTHEESSEDFNYIFNELEVVKTFGMKKSPKFWEKMAGSWDGEDFSNGAQGTILGTQRLVAKCGIVGPEEIGCQRIAASHGLAPKIYSAEVCPDYAPQLCEDWVGEFEGGHMMYGRILMERVGFSWAKNGGLWEVLPKLHKLGIAHRDLHRGNFGYNTRTQRHILLDFGMATKSPTQALHEGISMMGSYGSPVLQLEENLERLVQPTALKMGVSVEDWAETLSFMEYRSPRYTDLEEYEKLDLSDEEIFELIDLLYYGI